MGVITVVFRIRAPSDGCSGKPGEKQAHWKIDSVSYSVPCRPRDRYGKIGEEPEDAKGKRVKHAMVAAMEFSTGIRRRRTGSEHSADQNRGHRQEAGEGFRTCLITTAVIVVLILAVTGIVHITASSDVKRSEPPDPETPLPPSPSILRIFERGAVCSDGPPCSSIGSAILEKNGSAVDAAIATLFCNGIVNCHSMGLGGGFLMTIYDRKTGQAYSLNARETAPAAASEDMFKKDPESARRGPLATGVPGELAGYWEAHQRFGRLPWKDIVAPSLEICQKGYNMTAHQENALDVAKDFVRKDKTLSEIFVDPSTGKFRKAGSLIVQPKICETLKIIAEKGADEFYRGKLGRKFAADVQEMGGIVTEVDLAGYRALWSDPVKMGGRDESVLYSSPPPGSGSILALILNILDGYNFNNKSISTVNDTILTYHRMVEAFKFAFAKRTALGDPKFNNVTQIVLDSTSKKFGESIRKRISDVSTSNDTDFYGAVFFAPEDHGTAHVSVISPEGDAVSVTSTVNLYFGAGVASKSTGILLSSGMDDFSSSSFFNFFGLPGSPANKVEPGKQPLSSMSPTIVVDRDGEVRLVIGAAGGTKIPTSIAYVLIRHLWFGEDIKTAVDSSRIHHQLFPMSVSYEYGVVEPVVNGLRELGQGMTRYRKSISVICAIAKVNGTIIANADYRKKGDVRGF